VRRFDGDENEIIDVVDEEKKDEIVIAAEDTGEGMTKSEKSAPEFVDDDDEFLNAVNSVVENESKDDKTSHVSFRYECVLHFPKQSNFSLFGIYPKQSGK